MSYKGNDLDLRTPYPAGEDGAIHAGLSSLPEVGREGPIPVDHTVLACCNAAYDAAVFHGTRDVRLEHLLYALTRVEGAREVLEQHGVRTQQLRRDMAAAIAADVPAGSGHRPPRTAPELESLLRRAAGRAGKDNVPASVQDVLRAVLGHGREAPATGLLLRSASDPQQLERWAAEVKPPVQAIQQVPALPPAFAQEIMARLETLETTVQTLAGELASDRKALLDMMGEIQHELRAARQESATPPPIVLEKIDDVGKSVTGLAERFDAVRAIAAPNDTIEARFGALESRLNEQPAAIASAIGYMLDERRAAEPEPLQLTATESPGVEVTEKLTALETMMRGQWERIEEGSKAHERDLNELFEALVKLGSNQQTLAHNLESWRLDTTGDVSIVSNRLKNLEEMLHEILTAPRREDEPEEGRAGSFKRWLYGTAGVLPNTWRPDPGSVGETVRPPREADKN